MRRLFLLYATTLVAALAAVTVLAAPWRAERMVVTSSGPEDFLTVTLTPEAADGPVSGRLVVFMIDDTDRRMMRRIPINGPFWEPPQPIFSMAVRDWAPGTTRTLPMDAPGFPAPLGDLDGRYRVQVVLDHDQTERSRLHGPGNIVSGVVKAEFSGLRTDRLDLNLAVKLPGPPATPTHPNVDDIRLHSPLLSAFYGHDVFHRAAVARPPAYDTGDPERRFAAVYRIPGYGGRLGEAATYGVMLDQARDLAPEAVYVLLDPESPLGHHGFCDSPNHGPRGTALVQELIPYLEQTYRLAARPEGRLLTGHSSGAWTSLWLQLRWPDVFGGCWASAPDPVDFTAFQNTNIYEDANVYVDAEGAETASYRVFADVDTMKTAMTVRQEGRMEWAIAPDGTSGEQWDAWEAMFSPRDDATGLPKPLFDGWTGVIDHAVAEHWRRFDITARVLADWDRLGPVLMERVRLFCGTYDSFFLNRAVERLKTKAEARAAETGGWTGPGSIRLLPEETHGTVVTKISGTLNEEMRAHLFEHGLMATR